MALSRITNVDATMASPVVIRVRKKDTGDTTNTHAGSTVRLKPSGGSTYYTGSWVYSPSTAGGGYTHYADITGFSSYYLVTFDIEVRDTSGDSWEVFSSQLNIDVQTVLYEASASVPGKPTLTITGTTSSSQALSWSAPTGSPTGYRLYRSTSSGSGFVQIGGNLASTSYNSTGLAAGTRYYYYLIAYNGTGDSTASDTVSEVTTSAGGGTETPVPTVIYDTADDKIYRHASRHAINIPPFAVGKMEQGPSVVYVSTADSTGLCVFLTPAKIPVDVSTVRFRAEVGSNASAWTAAIDVVDGPNSIPWAAVLPADGDKFEAWKVSFTGDPDSLPNVNTLELISLSPRDTQAQARLDAQVYLNSL